MKLRAYFSLLHVEWELWKNLCPVQCNLPECPDYTRILSSKCSWHCLAALVLARALATQGWQILHITERATANSYLHVVSEASCQASISLQDVLRATVTEASQAKEESCVPIMSSNHSIWFELSAQCGADGPTTCPAGSKSAACCALCKGCNSWIWQIWWRGICDPLAFLRTTAPGDQPRRQLWQITQ